MSVEFSPLKLIQEELRDEPWKLLVGCMLLNQTSYKQVRPILDTFFSRYSTPERLRDADIDALIALIRPLGFYNKRAHALVRFAAEFAAGDWQDVRDLHGIGKYASDSYRMFVLGDLSVEPSDKKLISYKRWHEETHG